MSIECPYSAKDLGKHEYNPGAWKGTRVGVFRGDEQIGEYLRNYHSYAERTFCPFMSHGEWFALYSKDYTCTRIMRLPDCQDIGGEEPHSCGFCPVELYVPVLCTQDITWPKPYNPRHDPERWATKDLKGWYQWPDSDPEYKQACADFDSKFDKWMEENPFTEKYAWFGFVAGCVWGDDCSWKVQHLDLTDAHLGKLTRDERFGYIELPAGVRLRDAIDTDCFDTDHPRVRIAVAQDFELSGKAIEA